MGILEISNIFIKTLGLTIPAFIIILIINVVYFNKVKRGYPKVMGQFHNLMVLTAVIILYEFVKTIAICVIPGALEKEHIAVLLMDEGYITFSMAWVIMYASYIAGIVKHKVKKVVLTDKKSKAVRRGFNVFMVLVSIVVSYLLSFDKVITTDGNIYLVGNAIDLLSNIYKFGTVICFVILVVNRKKIPNIYLKPFVLVMLLYVVVVSLEKFAGYHINYLSAFFTFTLVSLFFTVENQDIQVSEDYKEAKIKEKQLEEIKQKMVVNLSNKIRTPLNKVLGYTELSLEGNVIDNNDLEDIDFSIKELENKVVDLIDLSEIYSDNVKVEFKEYDNSLFYINLQSNAISNKKENVMFSANVPQSNFKTLNGDSQKIYKIITNIIDNAFENTEYGEVKLEIEEKKVDTQYVDVIYTISNSGHTMTEEMFNQGIDSYFSEKNDTNNMKISLAIAKKYVDALGGNIDFINKEGQGTKYIVTIRQKYVEKGSNV